MRHVGPVIGRVCSSGENLARIRLDFGSISAD
jgi:hypothetical protein